MGVGLKVGVINWYVGRPEVLHAFFSTASVRLETDGWGSRFPRLLNELYRGELGGGEPAKEALAELQTVRAELSKLPPSDIVWDVYDQSLQPPWGDDIDPSITNLGNYFQTSDDQDLLAKLDEALQEAAETGEPLRVVTGVAG